MNDRPKDPSASVPRVPSDMSERLRQKHGGDFDPMITLGDAGDDTLASGPRTGHAPTGARSGERYTFEGEIGRGGMGAVLRVHDQDLRCKLAMKVMLLDSDGSVDSSTLGRFLEEAQVTAQLDHPGVVPVHELGLDGDGQVYFTMKLVKGADLRSVFDKVKSGEDGWNTTRVLNLLLRVCEAMAFAHSKGVIHRDLKPANIMVGRFGEVYVMDWGIARVQGTEDRKDLRIRQNIPQTSIVRSDRKEGSASEDSPDSPLLTMDGDVVGTPAYMPIEQAEGRVEEIGPESDVYSLGAILYELLAGQMPYVRPGARMSPRTILQAVIHGPPKPLEELAPSAPPELVAIADKAMARSKEDRYSTTVELAEELRAFLENRVVQAYRTGALVELRKWVQRNKALAGSLVAATLLALGGTTAIAVVTNQKNDEIQAVNVDLEKREREATAAKALAERREGEAKASAQLAQQREREANEAKALAGQREGEAKAAAKQASDELERRRRLSDLTLVAQLQAREGLLWPARPDLVEDMKQWLADAETLRGNLPDHEVELARLRESAAEVDDASLAEALARSTRARDYADAAEMQAVLEDSLNALDTSADNAAVGNEHTAHADELRTNLESLETLRRNFEADARESIRWRFPGDTDAKFRHDNLTALIEGAQTLLDEELGLVVSVRERLARAELIEEETVDGEFDAWVGAMEGIASSEKYGGWELPREQVGLVPIGPDPDSGLWEFWQVESGSRPERDEDTERITVTDEMGIVLVLIPGGTFWMGASRDPGSPNHDPEAHEIEELPVHEVTLEPYLFSKYELTQAQWFRLTGERPSEWEAGGFFGQLILDTNPVESVSWEDCMRVLPRYGMRLPTEAQWECACRAGSGSPWWCGDLDSIAGRGFAGNLFDEGSVVSRGAPERWGTREAWDDGHAVHAPVGTFRANGYGLYDVLGNVSEWCEDWYFMQAYSMPFSPEDGHRRLNGLIEADVHGKRVYRGGGYGYDAIAARSAGRLTSAPTDRHVSVGVRPAQGITSD